MSGLIYQLRLLAAIWALGWVIYLLPRGHPGIQGIADLVEKLGFGE